MSSRKPTTGGITDARCTRCRTVTNHIIIALVDGQPARVRCNTCGGEHRYFNPVATAPRAAKAATAKAPTAKRSPRDPKDKERQEWEELRLTMNPEQAKPYSMTGAFKAGQLLSHPTFGLGLVQQVLDKKMYVLFQDGKKLLLCG